MTGAVFHLVDPVCQCNNSFFKLAIDHIKSTADMRDLGFQVIKTLGKVVHYRGCAALRHLDFAFEIIEIVDSP